MPWRLVVTLILMALMIVFVGLNLENVSDISFGFYLFEQIPVYISLFASFILGVLITLPFTFIKKRKKDKTKKPVRQKITVEQEPIIPPPIKEEDKVIPHDDKTLVPEKGKKAKK